MATTTGTKLDRRKKMDIDFCYKRMVREDGLRALYVRTTKDQLQLPVAVADTPSELARLTGASIRCVLSSISHKRLGWYKIILTDEDTRELDEIDAARGNLDAIHHLEQRSEIENGREE